MSQQFATDMAQAPSPSSAPPAAGPSTNTSSKKRKVDEFADDLHDEPSPDEMTDEATSDTATDSLDHTDAPASKKPKVSGLPAPSDNVHEEAEWVLEHREKPANRLQVLKKKHRDEYVKSSRKARSNPHRPRGQEEEHDEAMVDQKQMPIQQANGAQQDPVTGDADIEMQNAQSVDGSTSLEALAAADAAGNGTGDQNANGHDAAGNSAGPSSSNAPVVAPAFNRELPPLYTPWIHTHAQAHARYAKDTPCPINWDAFSDSDLETPDREAYEFRAPWNPKPVPWEAAVKAYEEKHGEDATIHSSEGLRKRFKRANRTIYEKEGVYFHMSSLGLEDHGIPVDAKVVALEKAANKPKADDASDYMSDEDGSKAKKEKRADLPCHVRKGEQLLTIQKLFWDCTFAKTIDERDMLLDKIYRELVNEKALNSRYGGNGAICEGDVHEIVRLLDLTPSDVGNTSGSLRKLLVDIILHGVDVDVEEVKKMRREALSSDRHAEELYKDFAYHRRQTAIESFMESVTPEAFCEMYHYHHEVGQECYRNHPHKDNKPLPNIVRSLKINGVWGYTIENKTELGLDMQKLISEERKWDWERVKAVSYYIHFPPRGPQRRSRIPQYYRPEERDVNGRYPSHPEYKVMEGGPISALEVWAREAFGDAFTQAGFAKFRKTMFTRNVNQTTKKPMTTWEEDGWGKPFGAE